MEPVKMKNPIEQFAKALDIMREVDPEIQAQTIAVFLEVARHPQGIRMQDVAKAVGISQSSISRNVAAMSHTHRLGKPGHNLVVAFEDPAERRRKLVRLTDKGMRYMGKLESVLGGT
jgi:DNA-binding MarR family transcriptional regulator